MQLDQQEQIITFHELFAGLEPRGDWADKPFLHPKVLRVLLRMGTDLCSITIPPSEARRMVRGKREMGMRGSNPGMTGGRHS